MSDPDLIFFVKDRLSILHDRGHNAINRVYTRAYDEAGAFIKAAVCAGLDYASENNVTNWIVDVSGQVDDMSDVDQEWESSEAFFDLFRASSIRNILLVVSPPAPGKDLGGAKGWADGFAKSLGPAFKGSASSNDNDTRAFFA